MRVPSLTSSDVSAFADLWYETRAVTGRVLPAKADLPMRRLKPFLSHVSLSQEEADGSFRYVLFGTGLVRDFGVDLTGRRVTEHMNQQALALTHRKFAPVRDAGLAKCFARWKLARAATTDGRKVTYEGITFPYLEGEEARVRYISFGHVLGDLEIGEALAERGEQIGLEYFDAREARPAWLHLSDQPLSAMDESATG